ncbi:polysaccharide pyruvyl transferase family protein [Sphingomonas daechungensis]|uniref:polysaccharide pyruvyl transferase family protein n=1 Tax=Sphingomonas daechungensis TaxID=1176646 RepID=UPI0037833499
MTRAIDIDEGTAAQGHRAMSGEACALADALDHARQSLEPVTWRVAVGPDSVYAIEAVHRLAAESGIDVRFVPSSELAGPERVFFDDYVRYRLPITTGERLKRFAEEWTAAGLEALSAMVGLVLPKGAPPKAPDRLNSVVIIGAYGGDHIGDAAILGGTLRGLHTRYGVTRATVMSGRPAHTRKLAEGLSTPVEIDVAPYRAGEVRRALAEADGLVLGGGPLYGSPRILARHLAAVSSAHRRGLPFLVERIGLAYFGNAPTRWAGRRILESASRISVRTSASARHPLMEGLAAEIDRDPAFDYLEARGALDRLSTADAEAVGAILAGADDSLKIGINLRPTLDQWRDLSDLSRDTVDRVFMAKLAEGLIAFARASRRPVTYVFFPMNAIQLGMSDLSAAYELRRAVKGAVDLRVWEADAGLDGVVHLLRRLDAAMAMRFHASIFAVTQDLPLIGLDYFSGAGGKVSELLTDLGRPEDASTVGRFTPEWLVERLVGRTTGSF